MIVRILGKRYRVPEHPREISFSDFVSINTYLSDVKDVDHTAKVMVISLLTKCPIEDLERVMEDDLDAIYSALPYLHGKVPLESFNAFVIGRSTYCIKDLKNLTVKEYISIDRFFRDGETPYDNLDRVFSVVVRKVTHQNKSLRNILLNVRNRLTGRSFSLTDAKVFRHEDLNDDNIEPYSEMIYSNFTASEAMHLMNAITDMRLDLQGRYAQVFEPAEESEGEEIGDRLSVSEIWGWYHTVLEMVDHDRQKFDYWLGKPMEDLLTYLAYRKQYNLEQQQKNK